MKRSTISLVNYGPMLKINVDIYLVNLLLILNEIIHLIVAYNLINLKIKLTLKVVKRISHNWKVR